MILSSLAIVGTLGAGTVGAGVKVYRDNKRKREYPWSVAAERIVKKRKKQTLATQLTKYVSKMPQAVPAARQKVVEHIEPTVAALGLEQKYIQHYWRPYWRQGTLIMGCLFSYQGMRMVAAYLVKVVVDGAAGMSGLQMLPLLGGTLVIAYPLGLWLSTKAEQLIARVQSGISNEVRADLFTHLQTLSLGFFKTSQPGDVSSRFISDLDKFIQAISYNFIYAAFRLTTVGLVFAQLWLLEWHLALLVFGPLPIAVWLYNYMGPQAVEAVYRFKGSEGTVNNLVQENVHVQPMIKSFEAQDIFGERFEEGLELLADQQYEALFKNSLLRVIGVQSLFFCEVAATVGGAMLVLNQVMTPGSLVAFLALWAIAKSNFSAAVQYDIPDLLSAAGAGQRLEDIMLHTPAIVDSPDAYALPPFREAIRFESVSFSYNERQTNLDGASFTIPAGQHVAIVGANGAGKSTILNLLMRFYDPDAGRITFDGHDIRGVTRSSLRSQMSIVFQQPLLFDTTIANNIRVAKPDASEEEIVVAAQQAQIHDFIVGLPAGYETVVGEGGGALSGGQKQKIAIARALLRDPVILILDEVTNGLDAKSQAGLMEAINGIIGGRTVITITHHDAELEHVDQILMLQGGRIVKQIP